MAGRKQDFARKVEQEYLEKGHLFQPAKDFISKLGLCLGSEGKDRFLDLVIKMTAVAKNKAKTCRNNRTYTRWLKEAAKELYSCELAERQWICDHVWKLPPLKVTGEQVYDPDSCRKDIRLKNLPQPTAKPTDEEILKKGENEEDSDGEMDWDMDLLASPKPSHSTKSDNRTEENMEVDAPLTPRRSPRLAKKVMFSPVRPPPMSPKKKSPLKKTTVRASCSAVSSSSSSRPASHRDSERASCSSDQRKESRGKQDKPRQQHRSDRSDSRQTERSRHHQDRSKVESRSRDDRKDSKHQSSHPSGKPDPCSSSRVLHSEEASKRSVTWGDEGKFSLVISTDVHKRKQTDDLPSQAKSGEEEKVKRRRIRRSRESCIVPGCQESAHYAKAHAFKHHLPGIFDERLPADDERVLRGRSSALTQAGRWLMTKPITLEELVQFVKMQHTLDSTNNVEVTTLQTEAMRAMCHHLSVPVPDSFMLEPLNSPAALIHWRAALLIAASLQPDERQYWRSTFPAPEGLDFQGPQIQDDDHEENLLPKAFDSHFHLDRTLRDLRLPEQGTLQDVLAKVPVDADKRISLGGTVAVFCDPATYPTDVSLEDLPEDMYVAVGFHPRHATYNISQQDRPLVKLARLLKHPKIRALGEIGLDHTESYRNWPYQLHLLKAVLPMLEDRHVLVLHCRGMKGDNGTEAYMLLLHFLKQHVRRDHSIHLHCFSGDQYVLHKWLEAFPRTYFGFTTLVKSFKSDQVEALKEIGEDRILLESDAPYFPSMGSRVSSPGQLYTVASYVGQHRQMSVEKVFEVTSANAFHLYHGQFQ